ncbi:dihydrodipicolinate synthase family protein, partial [Rhodobacterales bacterium HKCCE2091]|nr:dihydrodipicolinate synthase family protein [Rhodobacterales bacterium HKCCE2091]
EHQSGIGLAIRKHILALRGAIAHETVRTPGPKLSDETRAETAWLLQRLKRKDPVSA